MPARDGWGTQASLFFMRSAAAGGDKPRPYIFCSNRVLRARYFFSFGSFSHVA